jgi:hypothetical protein
MGHFDNHSNENLKFAFADQPRLKKSDRSPMDLQITPESGPGSQEPPFRRSRLQGKRFNGLETNEANAIARNSSWQAKHLALVVKEHLKARRRGQSRQSLSSNTER